MLKSETPVLNNLISFGKKSSPEWESLSIDQLIKMVRHRLGMTQAQLAKRAGLVQSHIAEIESGKVDVQLSTLRKIFSAMECDLMMLPRFREKPDVLIARKAKEVAKKKIARISGTMALEMKSPDERTIQTLIRTEEDRLKKKPSSEVWEE